MDLRLNRIPEGVETIHIIAVCGTGMGALACMLKDMGYAVTGSDQNVYPPMSDFLEEKGVSIREGFDGKHLDYGPDLVIVGNAVTRVNPEAVRMVEMGLNFCSMPQALNAFAAKGKETILVCGTHGKTSTSSLLAWVLHEAGLDPSFMIGGIVTNFGSNYRLGEGKQMVIEGDEYDTAFFDKGAKFFHYAPHISILTSVEFDHADIFRDLDHVRDTFGRYMAGLPEDSLLLAYDGDRNVDGLMERAACRSRSYGRVDGSPWRLGEVRVDPPWNRFEVLKDGARYGTFRTHMVGEHNLLNALSVIAAAHELGVGKEDLAGALETFRGVRRRQEVRGTSGDITVMDDFAHHPTAVRETINGVKPFYPEGRLIAVFEPRTNSSMRRVFQEIYPESFDQADMVCIRQPSMLEKVPEGERFSSEQLVADLRARGRDAAFFSDTESIIDFLGHRAEPGDLILVMSNGGFDGIHEKLLETFEKRGA